jgi:hypothetical protein
MAFEESSVIRRRIDDMYFEARVVLRGDPEVTGVIEKIVYLDDQRTEARVPIEECEDMDARKAETEKVRARPQTKTLTSLVNSFCIYLPGR